MNRKWILVPLMIYLFKPSFCSYPTKDPLIFNPYTLEIYDLENIASSTHDDGLFNVACPAETPEQFEFDREVSMDGKALFVRRLLEKDDPELHQIKCKNPYLMALVYQKVKNYGHLLGFGYEIYYTKYQVKPNFILDDYDFSFGIAEEMDSRMKRFTQFFNTDLLENVELAQHFVWISKIDFSYNSSKWCVKWVSHTMSLRVDQLKVICETNDLGSYLYNLPKGRTFLDFYSQKNQVKIFNRVNLPTSVDGICLSQHKCLEEYNLVKPYHFQTHTSQPVKCSKLTSIPIWYKTTKELLDYSQNFIIALAQTIDGNRMKVLTGVHDVLTLSKKGQNEAKKVPIYLYRKKLPVPKIIYKIVTFEVPNCDPKISACRLNVVIFIHNGPEILPQERLCDDKCTEWGWDSIQFLSTTNKKEKSQFIYCCELDRKLHKRLAYSRRLIANEIFNLRSFQYYKGESGSPNSSSSDIHTQVENKMNELFTPKLYSVLGALP